MRGTATAPNSPRDIMLGLVEPIDPIHSEIASKSKPRQTESLGPSLAWTLMTHRSLLPGGTQRKEPTDHQARVSIYFPHNPPRNRPAVLEPNRGPGALPAQEGTAVPLAGDPIVVVCLLRGQRRVRGWADMIRVWRLLNVSDVICFPVVVLFRGESCTSRPGGQ